MEVLHSWKFFRRHMPQQPANYASFGWAMAGILVKNTLRGSPAQIVGNLQGLAGIASDIAFSNGRTKPMTGVQ